MAGKTKICILASVAGTLRTFYSPLIENLVESGYEVTLIASPSDELEKTGRDLNCNVLSACVARQITPFRDLVSICRLALFFHGKVDIVHAHTPKGGLIGVLASWLGGVPVRIYTIHGLVLETAGGIKRKILRLAEWLTCRLSTQVIAVSPSLKSRVVEEGICPSGKISVLGSGSACGIDLNKYSRKTNWPQLRAEMRTKFGISEEAVVVGYVGRLVPDKGIKPLVCAFEQLQKEITDCYLVLVGNIERDREMLDDGLVEKLKNARRIICTNRFVDEVLPFYAMMDMVVLPSKREGFGLTLIEAAGLELPVIATKITGCVDAVVDGQTGLLTEPDDVKQLTSALMELAKSSRLREKLGQNGRSRTVALFDSRELVRRHMDLYKHLCTKTHLKQSVNS